MHLTGENVLVVLTTAPTGLGHIRVMDAIKDGLAPGVANVEIGVENMDANKIHALGSRIPLLIKITEFYQKNPIAERIVTSFYVSNLKRKKDEIVSEFASVAAEFPDRHAWVIISTHFALAYSILAAKKDLEENFGLTIFVCVVMSDDSPQRVWAVDGADLIFAPSEKTREGIIGHGIEKDKVKVVSYPISPRFTQKLSNEEFKKVSEQADPNSKVPLQISVPISGAAVQLPFYESLIKELTNGLFEFTVVGLSSGYTLGFFQRILALPRVQTSIGSTSVQTVKLYESIFYQPKRPLVEITKPSEQTFKALISPNQRGGVILLLTDPIGRQEYDNLEFLIRHKLIPDDNQQKRLEDILIGNNITEAELSQFHYDASHFRALRLPSDPVRASLFIKKLREKGILASMLSYIAEPKPELTSDGVKQIWEEINTYLENYNKENH